MTKVVSGLAVSSGILSVCFQTISWIVESETEYSLGVSWFKSYVGSMAILLGLATVKAIFSSPKNV